jgi:hypothetical protein
MSLTLMPKNPLGRIFLDSHPEYTEAALITVYRTTDTLREHLDDLAIRLETLLRERAHIAAVLATFYRAELSTSSVQPILDLAVQLTPELAQAQQLPLKETQS